MNLQAVDIPETDLHEGLGNADVNHLHIHGLAMGFSGPRGVTSQAL